ncbi:hypothetical protein [Streptomyces sp. ODS28]|uniref:hypothetical protein n=1 Tax=Streptomyces sp. ODS28 TaxID=3136688 RepID=UPI0031EACA73
MSSFQPPRWAKPAPLGYGQAADAAHFVAAPLLASAGVALIGVIGADGGRFRWPGATMLALSLAVLALVGSVQYGFHARALLYSVADLEAWWGTEDLGDRQEALRSRQHRDYGLWKSTIDKAVSTYNTGVALLGAGVSLCVAPGPGTSAPDAVLRWVACAVVGTGALAEFLWALSARYPWLWFRRGARN